jgi:hypothetical protein
MGAAGGEWQTPSSPGRIGLAYFLTSCSSFDWIDGSTLLADAPLRIWLIPW